MPMDNLLWGKEIGFIVDLKELLPVKQQGFIKLNYFETVLLQQKIKVN